MRGHHTDFRSFVKFECDKAVEAGIKIIVLYKSLKIDLSNCPEAVRDLGTHTSMFYMSNGKRYWDYQSVKRAFEE